MIDFKGAIFDLDGTLLDSMPMWEGIADEFLLRRGIAPRPGLRKMIRESSGQQAARYMQREYGLPDSVQEIIDGFNALLKDFYANRVQLKDGVADMLEALRQNGVKMAVATATDRPLVEAGLRKNNILHYFGRIFTCTEAGAGKDKPDIFFKALQYLGTDITETVVFEDALYAIKTAKAAGFRVTAVYDPSAADQQEEILRLADRHFPSFKEWTAANA